MTLFDRDATSADALLTDLYLDALLAGAVLDAAAAGRPGDPTVGLDPAARQAADRLRRDLARVHPSFRFEERLAARLAEAAVAMRVPLAAGSEGRVVAFRPAHDTDDQLTDSALDAPDPSGSGMGRRERGRPLIIGGALTSAALSIAGAAFVAWRIGRPGRGATPMARAARAVRSGAPARQPPRGTKRRSTMPSTRGFD